MSVQEGEETAIGATIRLDEDATRPLPPPEIQPGGARNGPPSSARRYPSRDTSPANHGRSEQRSIVTKLRRADLDVV
jgi:hypothetical protein